MGICAYNLTHKASTLDTNFLQQNDFHFKDSHVVSTLVLMFSPWFIEGCCEQFSRTDPDFKIAIIPINDS